MNDDNDDGFAAFALFCLVAAIVIGLIGTPIIAISNRNETIHKQEKVINDQRTIMVSHGIGKWIVLNEGSGLTSFTLTTKIVEKE